MASSPMLSLRGSSPRYSLVAICRAASIGRRPQHYHHCNWIHLLEKKWKKREWDFPHGLGPDVALVLKHWSLWIKRHIQVSEFKWRTHNNSILWHHLPSVDTWICCAHSFTCTSWCKKETCVAAQWDIEQNQFLFGNSVISSFLSLTWSDPTFSGSMLSGSPTTQVPLGSLRSWMLFSPASSLGGFIMAVVAIGMIHLS